MPASGARRLRSTSTASAFSGLTYSTRHRRIGSSGTDRAAIRSSAERNAANVLPEPVGATTSVWLPPAMALHAPSWAGVGAAKAPSNQAWVAGEKRAMHPSVPGGTDKMSSLSLAANSGPVNAGSGGQPHGHAGSEGQPHGEAGSEGQPAAVNRAARAARAAG